MTNQDRRGAAYHEAAHAIVALAVGLRVAKVEIGLDGDDSAGRMEIETATIHLSKVDGIAICLAGKAAAKVFEAPMKPRAYLLDRYQVDKLIEGLEEDSRSALKRDGYQRAVELLEANKTQVCKMAEYLIENCKIDHSAGFELLV
jgi:ATP-dependent Zn protease